MKLFEDYFVQSAGRTPNVRPTKYELWQRSLPLRAMLLLIVASICVHMIFGRGMIAFLCQATAVLCAVLWMAMTLSARSRSEHHE